MIEIRPCRGFEELQACVDLQVEVWGYCEGDVIPRRVFLVAQKIGGQVVGAFAPGVWDQGSVDTLVGFALSLPGVKTGSGTPVSYLHSHMLAVREGFRDQRIGVRLKLAQRDDALARGIARIEWTFDPLEIKNSYLNVCKLGAVARRYEEDFYGSSSSRLQGGLQTDRLVAEWWLGTERVTEAIAGRAPVAAEVAMEICVPAAIYAWKAEEGLRERAREVQERNRGLFQRAFGEGLAVVGFVRDAEGNGRFQLGRWAEPVG